MPEPIRSLHLTDPRAMRALAHPTRLRLLGELRARGPQTVGMLSEFVDEAPGSVSYHLRKLASFGFIEGAPEHARNRRERWWRSAHERTTWEPLELMDDPERRAAMDVLRRSIFQRHVDGLNRYLQLEPTLAPHWVGAAVSSDAILHLTSDQLAELGEELDVLCARWQARSDPDAAGSKVVSLIYYAFRR